MEQSIYCFKFLPNEVKHYSENKVIFYELFLNQFFNFLFLKIYNFSYWNANILVHGGLQVCKQSDVISRNLAIL